MRAHTFSFRLDFSAISFKYFNIIVTVANFIGDNHTEYLYLLTAISDYDSELYKANKNNKHVIQYTMKTNITGITH